VNGTRRKAWRYGACLSLLAAIVPARARAVSPEAEALFREGRRLISDGRISEACDAFSKSYAAEASSGTLLNLAYCHQVEGKVATASAEYAQAARLARAQGKPDRAVAAEQKEAALAPRLPRLTLQIARAVPSMTIATELGTIEQKNWGEALPLDPGVHHLQAEAPGYKTWSADLDLKEAEQKSLEIPALESEVLALPERAKVAPPPPVVQVHDAEPAPRHRLDAYLAGAGGLLAIAGTVF